MFHPPSDAGRYLHLLCLACGMAAARVLASRLLGHHKLFCSDECAVNWAILKGLEERSRADTGVEKDTKG